MPNYDFDWQWNYEFAETMKVQAGTQFIVRSVHDNSAANPDNPDPTLDVHWGEKRATTRWSSTSTPTPSTLKLST